MMCILHQASNPEVVFNPTKAVKLCGSTLWLVHGTRAVNTVVVIVKANTVVVEQLHVCTCL